jgi:crotonobetainyl-CoA:carnitine CoA-transferase CaiB-like acyl-CoA transferase
MMLADMGAEVIKVENPVLGDFIRDPDSVHLHDQANRNKRSITLDLRSEAGRLAFLRLLETADAFVTNARSDRNNRLGLDYATLSACKPDLVYCQTTGFGATGPYRDMPVHSQMMDALAGSLPVEVGEDGLTRPRPMLQGRPGTLTFNGEATTAAAVHGAMHIAAGLARAARTGLGCYIDVSAAEAAIASGWTSSTTLLNRGQAWRDARDPRHVARYQWYQTSDERFVIFCPVETRFWHAWCELVGRQDLKPRTYGQDLRHEIQAVIATRSQQDWVELALAHDLPISPSHETVEDLRSDAQLAARGIFIDATSSDGNGFTAIGQPALIDGARPSQVRPAPRLGEHSAEILAELGYSSPEIERLRVDGVISSKPLAGPARPDHLYTSPE